MPTAQRKGSESFQVREDESVCGDVPQEAGATSERVSRSGRQEGEGNQDADKAAKRDRSDFAQHH